LIIEKSDDLLSIIEMKFIEMAWLCFNDIARFRF